MKKKTWNGMCLAGKHGLDYQGQPCDLCLPKPEVVAWGVIRYGEVVLASERRDEAEEEARFSHPRMPRGTLVPLVIEPAAAARLRASGVLRPQQRRLLHRPGCDCGGTPPCTHT